MTPEPAREEAVLDEREPVVPDSDDPDVDEPIDVLNFLPYPSPQQALPENKTDVGDKDPSSTPFVSLRDMFHRRKKKMPELWGISYESCVHRPTRLHRLKR